jgi:hypothetical protein
MVETGSRRSLLGPAATAVLVLVVAGVVADGGRGDVGHPSTAPCAPSPDPRRIP